MDGTRLKEGRQKRNWTQLQAARALGVTQAYLSMVEKGRRAVSAVLAGKARKVYDLPATVLPLPLESSASVWSSPTHDFTADLAALGYPGFAYLKTKAPQNPAGVLLDALDQANLDARVIEGLPWLALTYVDMDWDWLVRNAKVRDRQNRLGFAVSLASEVAARNSDADLGQKLRHRLAILENARLVREDTFCHDSMTQAERRWLRVHRSPEAAHWNLLTDMKGEQLAYASL